MRRIFLLTFLSAGAFIAFAAVPATLFDAGAAGVSASAAVKLNSSKSNVYRKKQTHPSTQPGDPAGLAVSDEGASGSKKPTKSNK